LLKSGFIGIFVEVKACSKEWLRLICTRNGRRQSPSANGAVKAEKRGAVVKF
jgi:hypothetical protein